MSQAFPVVEARIRPITIDQLCSSKQCRSAETPALKALFLFQCTVDTSTMNKDLFTEKERGEVYWEKAYREQLAGKEPETPTYLLCEKCTLAGTIAFLGENQRSSAAIALLQSLSAGLDIILFDRNISRTQSSHALALGRFDSLAHFRLCYEQVLKGEKSWRMS